MLRSTQTASVAPYCIFLPPAIVLVVIGLLLLEGLRHSLQPVPSSPLPAMANPAAAQADASYWRLTVRGQLQATLVRIGNRLHIQMQTPFPTGQYVQCLRQGIAFEPGATYTLHFRAHADQPRRISAGIQWNATTPERQAADTTEDMEWLGIEQRTYTFTFVAQQRYGTAAFTVGRLPGAIDISETFIEAGSPDLLRHLGWLLNDHRSLVLLTLLLSLGPALFWRWFHSVIGMGATLVGVSGCIIAGDYLCWRAHTLLRADLWLALPLFAAELLSLIQLIGLQATLRPRSEPLFTATEDPFALPIYVLIPTVNEGNAILERTIGGVLTTRARYLTAYPDATVVIAVCNDGRVAGIADWQQAEALAERLDVLCITRNTPGGAKAGNIEYVRQEIGAVGAALIVLFDADQVPCADFLLRTVPYFADASLGWVQTPQFYGNKSNPVARWADEQQVVFYDAICPAKSPLNAACICGTNVVIRASALDSIGGLPQTSVTEDAAASLRLHSRWRSLYVSERLAEGLGPIDIAGFFGQQRRWATGMLDIMLRSGTRQLFGRQAGLTLAQRAQYLLSCSHYLGGLRDAIAFAAPTLFLLTGRCAPAFGIDAPGLEWHLTPLLLLSLLGMFSVARDIRRTGHHWLPLRAAMLGFGTFPVYLQSLWAVALGRRLPFAVTPKRIVAVRRRALLIPQASVFLLGVAALIMGAHRLAEPLLLEPLPVWISMAWVGYNLVLLTGFFVLCAQSAQFTSRARHAGYTANGSGVMEADHLSEQEPSQCAS